MILSDFHVHTEYCDGLSTIEETVAEANRKHMESIGFSSHSFMPFDTSYCMTPEKETEYAKKVASVSQSNIGGIEIYLGLERDFYSPNLLRTLGGYNLDYVIGSVHYIRAGGRYIPIDENESVTKKCIDEIFACDANSYAQRYFETVAQLAERSDVDIVGHFDLVTKFNRANKFFDEDSKIYKESALEALHCFKGKDKIIEINTGAVSRGYRDKPYPSEFILKEANSIGIRFILSSDSHNCKNLCFGFGECEQLLRSLGVKSVVVLKGNGFCEIGI